MNASKLKSGEIIEGGYYSESETTPVVMFSFYEIHNESLQELDINIINEEINHNFNFFDCMDVNNDQQKDIVAQVFITGLLSPLLCSLLLRLFQTSKGKDKLINFINK